MNLTELRKKSPILFGVVALIVVILFIVIISAFFNRPKPIPSTGPSPETASKEDIAPNIIIPPKIGPEQLSPETKEIREKVVASKIADNHGDILLHKTGSFIIEYIPSPDLFIVTIKKDPAGEAKEQAQEWFLNFGLKQQDLCNLPVSFILWTFDLRRTNPDFTSLPDGCTGTPTQIPQK